MLFPAGRLLAWSAGAAAALPFKRADEPLILVQAVDTIVSRRGDSVLSALKASLFGESRPAAASPGETPTHAVKSSLAVKAECRVSLLSKWTWATRLTRLGRGKARLGGVGGSEMINALTCGQQAVQL